MPFSIRPYRCFPVQCAVPYNSRSILTVSMAYISGFCLLITLLVLSSGPAYAEWVKLSGDDSVTTYADATTIQRTGDLVRMWELLNFQTLQESRNPYFSLKAVREYDCTLEQSRIISLYSYSGQMGTGEMVGSYLEDEVKWEPVMPGSLGQDVWKIACAK
jgi:hypothetical protein